jgi:mannose-6-phosphate isomerase-like protein (cupin superfamily)
VVRKYDGDTAALTAEYGIQIGRWTQYQDLSRLPFDAMWCVIPPGGTSNEDCHPEVEFAVVVKGHAVYESGGREVDAPAGSVILLDSEERHVIHNRSADDPLTILSIYWLPGQQPAGATEPAALAAGAEGAS